MRKSMRKILVAALAAGAVVAVPSQAADPVNLEFNVMDGDDALEPVKAACAVTVVSIKDMRNNKESIGTATQPVLTGEAVPWATSAFTSLKAWGIDTRAAAKPAPGGIGISADVTRSYVWAAGVRLNGMVAVTVQYTLPSGKQLTRKYRGSSGKTNVANAVEEITRTLNMAMISALGKIAAEVPALCSA
jgi:hypothetical protein